MSPSRRTKNIFAKKRARKRRRRGSRRSYPEREQNAAPVSGYEVVAEVTDEARHKEVEEKVEERPRHAQLRQHLKRTWV